MKAGDRQRDSALPQAPLRVVVVGAGRMGLQHARLIAQMNPVARLAGIVDTEEAARGAALAAIPGTPVHPSLDSLIAELGSERRPHVVHVCTPPNDHVRSALAAIAAGCHVYVEKPVADSRHQTARILESALASGRIVAAGHQLLFERPVLQSRALLPAVGTVAHVESYFAFRTVRRSPNGRAPLRADLQLLDVLPHPIYLLVDVLLHARPDCVPALTSLEIGPAGTVHALVRGGGVTGVLTVTLEGRPVENSLRIVGTNGELFVDLVRGTVRRQLGPGTSGIDKALSPYRVAWQALTGTTAALARRAASRSRGYPGLTLAFERFYQAILTGAPSPTPAPAVLATMDIWEAVASALKPEETRPKPVAKPSQRSAAPASVAPGPDRRQSSPVVAVTGGTGMLGRAVVEALHEFGYATRVIARRLPAEWERVPGAAYLAVDLGDGCDDEVMRGCAAVVHCAAATAGGFAEHERSSVAAAEHAYLAARRAGVARFIHVSSMGALSAANDRPLDERSPLEPGRSRGAYVWGKAQSERRLLALAEGEVPALSVVRPAAIIDPEALDPPGRLGKRVGNLFVAPGSPSELVGVVELRFAARVLAWLVHAADRAPAVVNLLQPEQPTRRDLVRALRQRNPDLRVVWLPAPVVGSLSLVAVAAQKLMRPDRPPTNLARVFRSQRYDLSTIRALAPLAQPPSEQQAAAEPSGSSSRSATDPAPPELRPAHAGT